MRKILKVTSTLGIASFAKALSGVARAKFLAWQLGPAGVGLVGQAQMYSVFAIQLCSLNMAAGITKDISKNLAVRRENRIPLIVDTAGTLQFIASIIFIIMVLPFSRALTKFLFSDSRYWIYFIGITLTTPWALYLIGMANPVFYGFRKISSYTKLTILHTLIGLILLFIFVYPYKIEGMFTQIIVISIIGFFMSYYFMKKHLSIRPRLALNLFKDMRSRLVSLNLFKYGLMSFIPGNFTLLMILYLRGLFMKQYGVDANGYFQVAYAISAYYLPFVTNGIWAHLYPEICSLKNRDEVNRELNQFARFILFASTSIAACCIILRKYIILMLFSERFMKSYDLLAIQAIGDIFFVLFCMFNASMMARRNFKGVIFIQTAAYNVVLLLSYLLLNNYSKFAFRNLNMAIAMANVTLVIVHMIYAKFDTGFVLAGRNISLFIKSMIFLAIISFLPDVGISTFLMKIAMTIIWILLSVRKDEAKSFGELVFSSLRKKDANA